MSQSPLLRSLKTIQGSEPGFGRISVVEAFKDTSFEIRRVYFTCEVKAGCIRGGHAHKTLTQLLICPFGAIEVTLDNGLGVVETVTLETPDAGLVVRPALWHTMRWLKDDGVLLVMASDHYDESDYIRNYATFLLWAKERERT